MSAGVVSRIIRKMSAMSQAVYRSLQMDLSLALNKAHQAYEAQCPLSPMVDISSRAMEQELTYVATKTDDRVGRFPQRMGSIRSGRSDWWPLEPTTPHKLPGSLSSIPGSEMFCQMQRYDNSNTHGQFHSSQPCEGHSIPSSNKATFGCGACRET